MKFTAFASFDRHLTEASPDHLSSCYVLVLADPFDQKYVADQLIARLAQGEKKRLCADEVSVAALEQTINSPSLFSPCQIITYERLDKLKKPDVEKLQTLVSCAPFDQVTLILMGAGIGQNFSQKTAFYQKTKQVAVALDLSGEKPWERSDRVQRWLIAAAREKGKVLPPAVAKKWVEQTDSSFARLAQELEKWTLFVGEKEVLTEKSRQEIKDNIASQTSWQLCDAIFWSRPIDPALVASLTLDDWQGLIHQLRYQIKAGVYIKHARSLEDQQKLKGLFPNLPSSKWAYYRKIGSLFSEEVSSKILQDLTDLEVKLRLGGEPKAIGTQAILKVVHARRRR